MSDDGECMGRHTYVKVCGITRAEDAAAAVAAGADAVGVVFAPSPRQVTLEAACAVFAAVPPSVVRVGVFVDAAPEEVARAVAVCGLTAVQFSGDESPADCRKVACPVIKVIHVGTDFGLAEAEPYQGHAAALLLDTHVNGKAGGTSQTFDWQATGVLPGWAPCFVAGGLDADNVGECIEALHPYSVDVSSGVESSPGIKDNKKIEAFLAAVRAADAKEM
jgi:phosphoribosylanthranilate isomerase